MPFSELRLEVNKRCNYACAHCYTDKRRSADLGADEALAVIDQAVDLGAIALSLTGGEPLVDLSRTLKLAQHGKDRGLTVRLNTNGHLISEENLDWLLSCVDEFQISVHSADADRFDTFVRRPGAFARVDRAIRLLVGAGARVSARYTLTVETAADAVSVLGYCRSLNLAGLKVRCVVPAGDLRVGSKADRVRLGAALGALIQAASAAEFPLVANDGGLGVTVPNMGTVSFLHCKCGDQALFVGADGAIAPCVFLREERDYELGNVKDTTLSEVIHGSAVLKEFVGEIVDTNCGNQCACACRAAELLESRAASTWRMAVNESA